MSELLANQNNRSITAPGRFFMSVEIVHEESDGQVTLSSEVITEERIELARHELRGIFSGEAAHQAESFYKKGLSDIVRQNNDTPEALFYVHVQQLTELANRGYDRPQVADQ